MATISYGKTYGTVSRPLATVRQGLVKIVDRLLVWQRRADERVSLGQMDDHMLKDIGLNRSDVMRESAKPFWKG